MPTFLVISRHAPEYCPGFNEKVRKATIEAMGKMDELLKKHGVKLVGAWSVPSEHTIYEVIEAPSLEDFQELSLEPEVSAMGAYSTDEIKIAKPLEESMKMLQQAK